MKTKPNPKPKPKPKCCKVTTKLGGSTLNTVKHTQLKNVLEIGKEKKKYIIIDKRETPNICKQI